MSARALTQRPEWPTLLPQLVDAVMNLDVEFQQARARAAEAWLLPLDELQTIWKVPLPLYSWE